MSLLVYTLGIKKYTLNEEELLGWFRLSSFILVMTRESVILSWGKSYLRNFYTCSYHIEQYKSSLQGVVIEFLLGSTDFCHGKPHGDWWF